MADPREIIRYDDFSGGLNDNTAPHLLDKNESPDMCNLYPLSQFGALVQRNGYAELNTDAANGGGSNAGRLAEAAICGLTKFYQYGGTQVVVAACKNNVFSISDAGAIADITTGTLSATGAQTYFATLNDTLYICNGNATDKYMKWTGTGTFASASATSPQVSAADVAMKYIATFQNRMAGVGTGVYGDYWFYSDTLLPETWTGNNAGYIQFKTNDGDTLQCFVEIPGGGIFFKRNSVLAMYGTAPTEWSAPYPLFDRLGTFSPRSVLAKGGEVYFWGSDNIIYRIRSGSYQPIGWRVYQHTKDLHATLKANVAAGQLDRHIWWAYSTNGTYNNKVVVYDTIMDCWTYFEGINASCFFTKGSTTDAHGLISGSSLTTGANAGRVFTQDSGSTDDGTAVQAWWQSRTEDPNIWPFRSDITDIWISAYGSNALNIGWTLTCDDQRLSKNGIFPITAPGTPLGEFQLDVSTLGGLAYQVIHQTMPAGVNAASFRIQVINVDSGKQMIVRRIALKQKGDRGIGWTS